MRLATLVVDDEPLAREGLRLWLERDPDVAAVREAADGPSAVASIGAERPDLVFLDVQMPGMDGFAVVRAVGVERMPAVVFVTAHDRYAVQAFEVNAVDYLLKPATEERFGRTLARAKARLRAGAEGEPLRSVAGLLGALAAPEAPLARLAVRSGGRVRFVDAADVDRIQAAENYVELHVGAACHLLHVTLSGLARALDPRTFLRVHRSTVVNVGRIEALERGAHGTLTLVLRGGVRVACGRTYADRVRALFAEGG
jgi:two-component system, LytTR family, response regulator